MATASSGAYAPVGAGAVVAAATHAPLTALMIIFELTNDYKIILPLMIACVIATMLATRLNRASIYTMKLLRRGLDLFKGRTLDVLSHLSVRDAMRDPGGKVSPRDCLIELISLFLENRYNSIFVVDEDDRLLGVIAFDDLRPFISVSGSINQVVIAHDIMHTSDYPVVAPDDGLDAVMRQLGRYRYEVPVVDQGKLVGAILAEDVIDRYNTEMFKREMASSMASSMQDGGRLAPMPGALGLSLAEVPVPSTFIGRSCAELDLRNRYGISILLVKSKAGEDQQDAARAPDAQYVFTDGDTLLAMGNSESVNRLQDIL